MMASPSAVILRVKRKRTDDAVPDAIGSATTVRHVGFHTVGATVVQGLRLDNRIDQRLGTLHLEQAAQQPEKKLRFSRVTDAAPMQAMLLDAGCVCCQIIVVHTGRHAGCMHRWPRLSAPQLATPLLEGTHVLAAWCTTW